jgi:hypothetical protein
MLIYSHLSCGLDPNNRQKPSNPPFEKKGNFGINYSLGTVTPGLPSTPSQVDVQTLVNDGSRVGFKSRFKFSGLY